MNSPTTSAVSDYFERFLHPKIGQPMLPGLQSLNVTFRLVITGATDASWRVTVQAGCLLFVEEDATSECECEYRLSGENFFQIVAARLNPKGAFFSGKVTIRGNLLTGLKVSTLMEEFFQKNPYPGEPT